MAALAGVPFPYESSKMPAVPENLKGTWIEGALGNDYQRASSPQTLYSSLDRVVAFSRERNVPVFCGEFGVYIPNAKNEDRVRWYGFVVNALNNRNIAWTCWDYYGGFGIFKTERAGDFNSDLNVDIVRALGFTPPAQRARRQESFRTGFTIYDDYPNRQFITATFWGNNDFSLYDTNSAEGEFSIRWGDASQYNVFSFDFTSNADLSYLVSRNYYLEFQARISKPGKFDVRFVNPETPSSVPWRMRYIIDENILPADGKWHTIRIPLSGMREHGAWVSATQQFISPQEKFSWRNVGTLQFVAEHSNMNGITVWFDNIKITQ
jgi:endoglucanase